MYASRFIKDFKKPTSWKDFENFVNEKGGFLSQNLKLEVHNLWNFEGNHAYSHGWSAGIVPVGEDRHGIIWEYKIKQDFRKDILKGLI